MNKGIFVRVADDSLANLGLLMLLLLGPLSEVASGKRPGFAPGVRAFLARRAIDGFAAIGWVADRISGLPQSTATGDRHTGYGRPFSLTR